jgi:hypothetical protein
VSDLSTDKTLYFTSSASSSSSCSRKSIPIGILSSLRTSSSFWVVMRFLFFILGIFYSILGNLFASSLTSTSAPLTLPLSQFLFCFQSNLICIFYILDCHHAHLILNLISQTIHISNDLLIITLTMTSSNVYHVKLLSVFLHCHPFLSQIMHSLE